MNPLAINLGDSQDLGTLLAGADNAKIARLVIGGVLGLALAWLAFKSKDFRSSSDFAVGGIVVGLCVLAAWYVTSNISVNIDDQPVSYTHLDVYKRQA